MQDCEIPAEDLAAGEGGGHGDAEETVEVEALAGEKEVGQGSAGGQDSAPRVSPIVTDTEGGTMRSGGVAGICQRSAGGDALNRVSKPRKP